MSGRAAIIVGLTIGLASCSDSGASSQDCLWIGGLNPLSGNLATLGLSLENAARLAVQEINAAGGVAGQTLCLAAADTRTNPERAPDIVEALVERNDIIAVNGPAASASTIQAQEAAAQYEMAMISCCSTSPLLSDAPNVFRTVPSDALQGVVLAEIAAGFEDVSSVAVIYINDVYGTELLERFRTAYRQKVGNTVQLVEAPFEPDTDAYAPVVRSAFASEVDLAVLIAFPLSAAEVIMAWRESRLAPNVRWLGTDGLKDEQFVFLLGNSVPQIIGTAPASSSPHFEGFKSRYQRAFGVAPEIFTGNQYDAVMLIALTLQRIGPGLSLEDYRREIGMRIRDVSAPPGIDVSADTLVTALATAENPDQEVNYMGVTGPVDLDENGDVAAGYREWSIQPGQGGIQENDVCYECALATSATVGVTCGMVACE